MNRLRLKDWEKLPIESPHQIIRGDNLDVLKGYNYVVQFLGQGDESNKFFKDHVHVPMRGENHPQFGQIAPVGRAASPTYRQSVRNHEKGYNNGESEISMEADGSLYFCYDVKKDHGRRIAWRFIGNCFRDEDHLWKQLDYLEGVSDLKVFEDDVRFPLVIPAYQQADLKNKLMTLETFPSIPRGKVVARQFPNIPIIEDLEARPLRDPIAWEDYRSRSRVFSQDGDVCHFEMWGWNVWPKDIFLFPKFDKKATNQYCFIGDVCDEVNIPNRAKKNITLVNEVIRTQHEIQYYTQIPVVRIMQADCIGLKGMDVRTCYFPDTANIEIFGCCLEHLQTLQGAPGSILFIENSFLSEDALLNIHGVEELFLKSNYLEKTLKIPACCKRLSLEGQGPDCLDLRACRNLQYVAFNERQQGMILLPRLVPQTVLNRILKRYTGAQIKYAYVPRNILPKKDRSR